MTKVAVCLFGMLGRYNKDKSSIPKDCSYALESLLNNVLKDVDYDIFAHTWSGQEIDKTFDFIKPKNYSVTPPIEFSKIDQLNLYISAFKRGIKSLYSYILSVKFNYKDQQKILNNIMSRYYSSATSVLLMKQFVEQNAEKYSHVMITRYDLEYFSKFNFSNLSSSKIYFGENCEVNSSEDKIIPNQFYWREFQRNNNPSIKNLEFKKNHRGLEDFWFICSYKNALKMSDLFFKINYYIKSGTKPNSHHLLERHVYENFSEEELDFYKTRLIDFDLSRRYRLNDIN